MRGKSIQKTLSKLYENVLKEIKALFNEEWLLCLLFSMLPVPQKVRKIRFLVNKINFYEITKANYENMIYDECLMKNHVSNSSYIVASYLSFLEQRRTFLENGNFSLNACKNDFWILPRLIEIFNGCIWW